MTTDWAALAGELEHLLRLRSNVFCMKLFDARADMDKMYMIQLGEAQGQQQSSENADSLRLSVVRELIDGEAGLRADVSNMPDVDDRYWVDHRERLEALARTFS